MQGTVSAAKHGQKIVYIQYLRGLAALMVVFHHILKPRDAFFSPLGEVDFGRPGVLIFFVISGFVMLHACREEPLGIFVARRIIRVVPLYWIMTLVFFLLISRSELFSGQMPDRMPELLMSLFFVPHYHAVITTEVWPLLVPGWTLIYEMFFFALFAIGIACGNPKVVTTALLLALVVIGQVFSGDSAAFVVYTNPFLLLFVAGMGMAELYGRGWQFGRMLFAFPLGFAVLLAGGFGVLPAGLTVPSFFVGAVLVVAGTLAAEQRWSSRPIEWLSKLGDSSYSLYLSHTIVMIPVLMVMRQLPLEGWVQFIVVTALTAIICVFAGLLIYRLLEYPMLTSMRRWVERGRQPATA